MERAHEQHGNLEVEIPSGVIHHDKNLERSHSARSKLWYEKIKNEQEYLNTHWACLSGFLSCKNRPIEFN